MSPSGATPASSMSPVAGACATIAGMRQSALEEREGIGSGGRNGEVRQAGSRASEPFSAKMGRRLRGGYRFLTREQARKSWFIFMACVAFRVRAVDSPLG